MTRQTFPGGVQVIEAGDMSPEVAAAVRDAADRVQQTIAQHVTSIALAFVVGVAVGYSLRRDAV